MPIESAKMVEIYMYEWQRITDYVHLVFVPLRVVNIRFFCMRVRVCVFILKMHRVCREMKI